jgi:hypothetical protein
MCQHRPLCPPAEAADHARARIVADHPEQGWCLLCNGVILFDDSGRLLPDGQAVPPVRRPAVRSAQSGRRATAA